TPGSDRLGERPPLLPSRRAPRRRRPRCRVGPPRARRRDGRGPLPGRPRQRPALEGIGPAPRGPTVPRALPPPPPPPPRLSPPSPLEPVSAPFHGRDLFAPVAAHLSLGARLEEAGEPIDPASLTALELPSPEVGADRVVAHAIHRDGYGNVTLDLDASMLADG